MNFRDGLKKYKRVVVKVGTSTLTYPNGKLNLKRIERLSWVLADIKNQGKDVILVSSGAIGVGSTRLGFKERPTETRRKQAAAAVGQAVLMQIYQNFFNEYNQRVAQILLTKEDFKEGQRKENTTNTFETLLEMDVIPIVNANDTISTYEIEFSDNDRLSAEVAALVASDLLIILSDIDCLYDDDPRQNPNAKRVPFVSSITKEIEAMAGSKEANLVLVDGGKIAAAKICNKGKVDMVIANGDDPSIVHEIFEGDDVGTIFKFKS